MGILDPVKKLFCGPRVHGVTHAGVTVSNFEEAIKWYSYMFDWHLLNELTVEPEKANTLVDLYGEEGLTIRLGFLGTQSTNVLEIFEFSPKAEPASKTVWNRPGYTHIAISVSNVPALKKKLEEKGAEFVSDVQFMGGAHWAFMRDPDGNLIELIDYHANRIPIALASNLVGKLLKKLQFGSYYI